MTAPVGAVVRIPLTKGYAALVDPEDAHLAELHWYAHTFRNTDRVYAARRVQRPDGKWTLQYLHQAVLGTKGGDHIDGNGLDCRRYNLRPATKAQNQQNQKRRKDNRSGFKGVHWSAQKGKWQAHIQAHGRRRHLGFFADPVDGARAYDKAARELHGVFARLNFPDTGAA